jgi:hypothetical protein
MTIHTYYRQHDRYEVADCIWQSQLERHDGDEDNAFQALLEYGFAPVRSDTTEFYLETEVCDDKSR